MVRIVLDTIATYLNPDLYHRFFFFLSTKQGILFERTIELTIFVILSYMVISEYIRSKKAEMRYFIFAFVSLMVLRLLSVVVNFNIVFGDFSSSTLNPVLPVSVHFIELFTLILLVNAFIYPVLVKKIKNIDKMIFYEIFFLILISIGIQAIWTFQVFADPIKDFRFHPANIMFILLKIVIICYALFLIVFYQGVRFKYRKNVFIAFSIYLLTPLIQLVNLVIFDYIAIRLKLFEFPFPLISVLLFTRIIYLKLVDKAYLKEKLEETERRYKAEKELSRLKDEFVSVVSHELRTPLTSMKLYCDLIHSGKFGSMTKRQHQAIHVIESECKRLNNLINDILNLSKLESGKDKVNLDNYDVSELKKNIMNQTAKQKRIKVVYDLPENLIVKVDKEKFIQLFVNLFSNALKFTEEGGVINITIKDQGDNWLLSVKDTGKGIEEIEIPKLFDKFYQVEAHMTRSVRGTGLGLAIVKSIVELHKGKIEVKSKPGKGSEFIITFPSLEN